MFEELGSLVCALSNHRSQTGYKDEAIFKQCTSLPVSFNLLVILKLLLAVATLIILDKSLS